MNHIILFTIKKYKILNKKLIPLIPWCLYINITPLIQRPLPGRWHTIAPRPSAAGRSPGPGPGCSPLDCLGRWLRYRQPLSAMGLAMVNIQKTLENCDLQWIYP